MSGMSEIWRRARRLSGLARFERTCRLGTMGGRRMRAWRIPGTAEAGRHAMLERHAHSIAQELRREEAP